MIASVKLDFDRLIAKTDKSYKDVIKQMRDRFNRIFIWAFADTIIIPLISYWFSLSPSSFLKSTMYFLLACLLILNYIWLYYATKEWYEIKGNYKEFKLRAEERRVFFNEAE